MVWAGAPAGCPSSPLCSAHATLVGREAVLRLRLCPGGVWRPASFPPLNRLLGGSAGRVFHCPNEGGPMATKADFTEVEWEALHKGMTGAGMLVSVGDRDFTDTFGEAGALAGRLREEHGQSASELVRELAGARGSGSRVYRFAAEDRGRDARSPSLGDGYPRGQGPGRGGRSTGSLSWTSPTPSPTRREASSRVRLPRSTRSGTLSARREAGTSCRGLTLGSTVRRSAGSEEALLETERCLAWRSWRTPLVIAEGRRPRLLARWSLFTG